MNYRPARFLLRLSLVLCLGAAACKAERGAPAPANPGNFTEIEIQGAHLKNGAFDVSLEYAPDGTGWMAYSRVQIPKFVETHLARSDDQGKTWKHVARIAPSEEGTFTAAGKTAKGAWRDETPSLIYDPGDVAERRWKLFTNHYFVTKPFKPKNRLMHAGTVNVKYAAAPEGPWSEPECVVGPHKDCRIHLKNAAPDLADVQMLTEPSAIVVNDVLYLAMDVGSTTHGLGEWSHYRIILLASRDRGASWEYVGKLLGPEDAEQFDYLLFTGASLLSMDGRVYVFATPSGSKKKKNKGHDGSMLFEVSDITKAQIAREVDGRPRVLYRIVPDRGSGGLADYDPGNVAGGVVFSRVSLLGFPRIYRLFETGDKPLAHR